MAEFKLGRIRFVWKNEWVASATYIKDDVIRYGGKTYMCTTGHVATADFYAALTANYWNLSADGLHWTGTWAATTFYKVGDIVKWGAVVYICKTPHTSQTFLESNQSNWEVFAASFEWKSTWLVGTYYKVGDVVKYGATVYRCNLVHSSAATATLGLEVDQSKWDIVNRGFDYKGTWTTSTVRYKINDVVKWGAGLWICTTYHTSTSTFLESSWAQFVDGLQFESTWNSSTIYQPGDIATYGGYSYVSLTNNSNNNPVSSTVNWGLLSTGFSFQGDWVVSTVYKVGQIARLSGYTYLVTADHTATTGNKPPNLSYWQQLNPGYKWLGVWASGVNYSLGDTVTYGVSTFVVVLGHLSASGNRPDTDLTGTYWNLAASGVETNVLTTQGDTIFYSGAGPARLPIGTDGQVLTVSGTGVYWNTYGNINNVFYVAPSGTDNYASGYGITIDKPFATIKYACSIVSAGVQYQQAKFLLTANAAWLTREMFQWMVYQKSTSASPFSPSSAFNEAATITGAGLVVAAVIQDLSRGTNASTVVATLAYFATSTTFYDAYTTTAMPFIIASLGKLRDLMLNAVGNTAPSTNYQSTTGYTPAISQYINTGYTAETSATTTITALIGIITTALNAASTASVPKPQTGQTSTISIKNGTYTEILPISIPENTALVGDELRGTIVQPAGPTIANTNISKNIEILTRLSAIISDVIRNIAVTPSSGNTTPQVTSGTAGTIDAGTSAAALFTAAQSYINFYVNATGTAPIKTTANSPTSIVGYINAVDRLTANLNFLTAEATAYIDSTYPATVGTYDHPAGVSYVTAYVNAIKSDLIYTGNYRTLLAARLYVNAAAGSTTSDMFYMRNGSGLRNMTLQGLSGVLGTVNSYGTKRPTAGAYVSLDPGAGVNDPLVWIYRKSPYVQNVTTFGTGCLGLLVDGAIHNGGNKSIVANDYTQVLSNGIGIWVANAGLAELVSVFTYFCHIGYLSENGGKSRATNGNNSYGDFGTVSEGVNSTEVAITAAVNTRAAEAQVATVLTNNSQIYQVLYSNAGSEYTAVGSAISFASADGANATAIVDEIRDNATFEVRLLTAGTGYLRSTSAAQLGNSTSITLAATDVATSASYLGLRVVITSGLGVGQYGYITSYSSGTKIANIASEATDIAGWQHVVPGTAISAVLDSTSNYSVEPRLTFNAPTFTNTARTIQSGVWTSVTFAAGKYVAVAGGGVSSYSTDGTTWATSTGLPGAVGAAVTAGLVGGTNYFVAVAASSSAAAYSTDGITWVASTLPSSASWTSVAYGNGRFVAVASGGTATAISTNGTTWVSGGALPATATWSSVAYGPGTSKFVAISGNGTASTQAAYSADGITWTTATLPTSSLWTSVTWGNNRFVAVAQGSSDAATSRDGITWTSRSLPVSSTWKQVQYGQGTFLAITGYGGAATTVAASSVDGLVWTARALPSATWSAVVFGNPSSNPIWVIIAQGGTIAGSIPNFTATQARAIITSGQVSGVVISEPGSGYTTPPTMTITSPLVTTTATWTVRTGIGALGNPTFTNRGTGYVLASATVTGPGYADIYQIGSYVAVSSMSAIPVAGANVQFAGNSTYYKLVSVSNQLGTTGNYSATLQVSPIITIAKAATNLTSVSMRLLYSQVRLTGHDFLNIGTGGTTTTNYPGIPTISPDPTKLTKEFGGGRVFFTATDQDGNFNVGNLFSVQQSTGVATLDATSFNLSGLQTLTIGAVVLGGSNTTISQFSTDGTFSANLDTIVPTQKAIKTYITSQIGGGLSSINVNTLVAGNISIGGASISNTAGTQINVTTKMNFKQGVDGSPLALNFFLL